MMRRYEVGPLLNLRDLGGYPVRGGLHTKSGRFFRSDAPANLTQEDVEKLNRLGVETVIDLRGDGEALHRPCSLAGRDPFLYSRHPLLAEGLRIDGERDVPQMYFSMIKNHDAVAAILRRFILTKRAVLFHCTAGKDRTGVIAALLLSLAGVARNDICADYQVSYTYIRAIFETIGREISSFPAFLGLSKLEYIEGFLALFEAEYASAERYMAAIGLSRQETDALREKLIG